MSKRSTSCLSAPGTTATTLTVIVSSSGATMRLNASVTTTVFAAGTSWCGGRRSNGSDGSLGTSQWPASPKQPPWPKMQNEPA